MSRVSRKLCIALSDAIRDEENAQTMYEGIIAEAKMSGVDDKTISILEWIKALELTHEVNLRNIAHKLECVIEPEKVLTPFEIAELPLKERIKAAKKYLRAAERT